MGAENSIVRLRGWYAVLLRLYPKQFHGQFGEPMQQAFEDVLRARAARGAALFGLVLWMFADTLLGAIRENVAVNIVRNKALARIGIGTAAVLSVPMVAMQFTDEVDWDLADFVVAGGLTYGAGLTYELLARKVTASAYRLGVGVAVAASLLLLWVNLAVGIIGNEENPFNAMYLAVVCIGLFGARRAHFEARRMARVAFGMALALLGVAVIAVLASLGSSAVNWPLDLLGATVVFAVLFAGAGLLFRHAARQRPVPESEGRCVGKSK